MNVTHRFWLLTLRRLPRLVATQRRVSPVARLTWRDQRAIRQRHKGWRQRRTP